MYIVYFKFFCVGGEGGGFDLIYIVGKKYENFVDYFIGEMLCYIVK